MNKYSKLRITRFFLIALSLVFTIYFLGSSSHSHPKLLAYIFAGLFLGLLIFPSFNDLLNLWFSTGSNKNKKPSEE